MNSFYVVVSTPRSFKDRFSAAWRRLTSKSRWFTANLYPEKVSRQEGNWDCFLIDHPALVAELHDHPVENWEVILRIHRPSSLSDRGHNFKVKTFGTRSEANFAMKEAVDNKTSSPSVSTRA